MIGFDIELWFWAIAGTVGSADERERRELTVERGARPAVPGAFFVNEVPRGRLKPESRSHRRLFVERRAYHRGEPRERDPLASSPFRRTDFITEPPLYVLEGTIPRAIPDVSALTKSLETAWTGEIQVHAFHTRNATLSARDVLDRLPLRSEAMR